MTVIPRLAPALLLALVACGGDKDDDDTTTDTTADETDTDTDADSDTDSDTDTDADSDTDTDADTDTDTGTGGTTDTAPNSYNLTLSGGNYQLFAANTIYFAIKDTAALPTDPAIKDSLDMATEGIDTDADGTNDGFEITWNNVLDAGATYVVAMYVDVGATPDGLCAVPPDAAFLLPISTAVSGDVALVRGMDPTAVNPAACPILNGP